MSREHETLLGPLVVGLIAGLLTALAIFGFGSEYIRIAADQESSQWWLIADHAFLGFVVVSVGGVLLFGILPLLIRRVSAQKN